MANTVIRLVTAQTRDLLPLESRSAGTYLVDLLIEGNSLLSTVFVKSISGTVKVNYHESTTGRDFSERKELQGHPLISAANASDPSKLTVTPFHNSPQLEVIVTGTAEFSVYATVVNTFASDLDAALQFDGSTFVPTSDKGLVAMCVDDDTNTLNFLRCKNGKLGIDGGFTITARLFATTTLAFGAAAFTLISHTPSAQISVQQILVGGDGSGEFTVTINSVIWGVFRNSWNDRQVIVPMGGVVLTDSDTIEIEVENISSAMSGSCKYEAFIYTG